MILAGTLLLRMNLKHNAEPRKYVVFLFEPILISFASPCPLSFRTIQSADAHGKVLSLRAQALKLIEDQCPLRVPYAESL